jgi:hypothetical protein
MVCHLTKFRLSSSNDSLLMLIKPKAKGNLHTATLFYFTFNKTKTLLTPEGLLGYRNFMTQK